ncbi:YciI family protein [Reichenbachiella ulvae]|uniref:YciI family protein n=1 Tax=Reichenbachiella ulvae TaxID=2980104 RepID=A0ABT3CTS9_9BACT|nr:YciI family protein [Reichenbachiella ulvae]MCV9387110.1 YciI family protein [Reichenbachiella ulvae]
MFIINLSYKVPLDTVDQHLHDHVSYLNENYAAGNFLASGRKEPRTGGIILAKANSLKELETIIAKDPFHQHELADYEITEFVASRAGDGLESLINK